MAKKEKLEGGERYAITSKGIIHKVDPLGEPDFDGVEYHIVEELADGYMVYIKQQDPSQPNLNYFIHKKYFVETK